MTGVSRTGHHQHRQHHKHHQHHDQFMSMMVLTWGVRYAHMHSSAVKRFTDWSATTFSTKTVGKTTPTRLPMQSAQTAGDRESQQPSFDIWAAHRLNKPTSTSTHQYHKTMTISTTKPTPLPTPATPPSPPATTFHDLTPHDFSGHLTTGASFSPTPAQKMIPLITRLL